MIEDIILNLILIIPLLFVKLTKSEDINYFLIIALAVLSGVWGFSAKGLLYFGVVLPFISIIISLVALLYKKWTINKTLAKTLKFMIFFTLLALFNRVVEYFG